MPKIVQVWGLLAHTNEYILVQEFRKERWQYAQKLRVELLEHGFRHAYVVSVDAETEQ